MDHVVKVLVVREDDVSADVEEEALVGSVGEARPPASLLASMRSHGPWLSWLRRLAAPRPVGPAPMTRVSTLVVDILYANPKGLMRGLMSENLRWWMVGDGKQTRRSDGSSVGPRNVKARARGAGRWARSGN